MATHTPMMPIPKSGMVMPNTFTLSSEKIYAEPTRMVHMATVDTTMENFASPVALNTLGSVNASGRISEVAMQWKIVSSHAIRAPSSERL